MDLYFPESFWTRKFYILVKLIGPKIISAIVTAQGRFAAVSGLEWWSLLLKLVGCLEAGPCCPTEPFQCVGKRLRGDSGWMQAPAPTHYQTYFDLICWPTKRYWTETFRLFFLKNFWESFMIHSLPGNKCWHLAHKLGTTYKGHQGWPMSSMFKVRNPNCPQVTNMKGEVLDITLIILNGWTLAHV